MGFPPPAFFYSPARWMGKALRTPLNQDLCKPLINGVVCRIVYAGLAAVYSRFPHWKSWELSPHTAYIGAFSVAEPRRGTNLPTRPLRSSVANRPHRP